MNAEKENGKMQVDRVGFDVLSQTFYVEGTSSNCCAVCEKEGEHRSTKRFAAFDCFYEYLNGEIYDNACYYQCDFSSISDNVDLARMQNLNTLESDNIDNYTLSPTDEDITMYQLTEQVKKQVKRWVKRFIKCDSFDKLQNTVNRFYKSELNCTYKIDLSFFFWNYVYYNLQDKSRFNILMQYMSTGAYPECIMIYPLCHVYGAGEVLNAYHSTCGSSSMRRKLMKRLKNYVERVTNSEHKIIRNAKVFFDGRTHYYCEKDNFGVHRYFETIDELLQYRNYDLSNVDLTADLGLEYDFSECKTDENTKLPLRYTDNFTYVVKKRYEDGKFWVSQDWYNEYGRPIKHYTHEFVYFSDFVAFLRGDLSDADLVMCEGLENLLDVSEIDFSNARIRSSVCEKFGIPYSAYHMDFQNIRTFLETEECENNTDLILHSSRDRISLGNDIDIRSLRSNTSTARIYYISDLHLMHTLQQSGAIIKSWEDVQYIVQKIVATIVDEVEDVSLTTETELLIGGDVASDFRIFDLFVRTLRAELDRKKRSPDVIFVLGNHELWDSSSVAFDEIVEKYKHTITSCGMNLLQNDILYKNSRYALQRITHSELTSLSDDELYTRIQDARIIFFGGLAFSGYNNTFNANNGIYRSVISRDEEIKESKCFEELYNRVASVLTDKRVVILTHMPMDCWREPVEYQKGFVYVSGHTHRNIFHDDGEIRVYADNQIGYYNHNPHLKYFDMDMDYDYFSHFNDGIHRISVEEYRQFYRGTNISMEFNWKPHILYVLKKNGYYCFIHESDKGTFAILNGGALKNLNHFDVKYYYNHLDEVIARLKRPLDKYTNIQKQIASEIQKMGGVGSLHGCIVDIDWNNHIYINPLDLKITAYWAADVVYKVVYSSVPELLREKCPEMYAKYTALLRENPENLPILFQNAENETVPVSQLYLDTDIYRASREIKKMQRLNANILTVWPEVENCDSGIKTIDSIC